MARYRIKWSVSASAELKAILKFYIERNGNAKYSRKLRLAISKSATQAGNNPKIGVATDYQGVRTIVTGNYQLFYELVEDEILILSVWDCRRNPLKRKY